MPAPAPSTAGDADLVRACLDGDGAAWEELIRRYRRLIYSIAIRFRLGDDLADDAFQRVALKLLSELGRLRRVESLGSWIGTVTRHECGALLRERRRGGAALEDAPEPADDAPGLADALAAVEREHALALALERLPPPCRTLLTALYVEDPTPSYTVIAERLGRPIGALGPTRARCLKKLLALYLEGGGVPP